jgi:hypothetical protein
MVRIGFTGTRKELTDKQEEVLNAILLGIRFDNIEDDEGTELHHGDCVGADEFAATTAKNHRYRVVTHPPVRKSLRAFFPNSDEVRDPRPFLARNHNIVDETDRLIALVEGPEHMRSGTWATIRYAIKVGKHITIIWPDGSIEYRR